MLKLLRSKRRAPILVLTLGAVMAMTVMMATPALAAEAGEGTVLDGTWEDDAGSTAQENAAIAAGCGGFNTKTEATWNQAGTYTAGDGTAVYAGPSTAVMTSTGNYRFDPLGSYGPTANCSGTLSPNQPIPPGVPGYAVPDTRVVVNGTLNGSSVSCDVTGSFTRLGTVVTITATGSCTVDPLVGTTATSTDVTHTWALQTEAVPMGFPPELVVLITGGAYSEN